jgi:hypothetical protein
MLCMYEKQRNFTVLHTEEILKKNTMNNLKFPWWRKFVLLSSGL